MPNVSVEELQTEAEWEDAFPVMMQLWEDTPREFTRESFVPFLHGLQETEGYRLFGLFVDETLVGLAGVSIRMSAWYGRYLWVYDLVIDSDHRSHGYGTRLVTFLKKWAKNHDCETIGLASALERDDAHRFYEDLDMEKSSYVFKRSIDQ